MYRGRFNWSNILKDSTALSGFEYTNRSRMQGIQAARAAYAQRAAHRGTNFLDNSGDMAKVFGMQPYPPDAKSERKVNEVNGGNAGPATAPMGVDKMKVRRAVQAIEEERRSPVQALSKAENYGYQRDPVPPAPSNNVFMKSMEQRIDVLEQENGTLRDVLVQQQKQMLERMATSESRILSEVQRRVDLEMEVRTKSKSTDVASSVIEKRLAQMERVINSQQTELGGQREMRRKLDEQTKIITMLQQRIDSAVQSVQTGAGGVAIVDEDLSRVKTLLRQKDETDKEFREREKRKGAVIFGEVSRLGKVIEGSSERMGKGLTLLQQRIEGLEGRLKSDERGIMAMEGRDAEKFVAVARRAEELEKQLIELTDATIRQKSIVDNESSERRRLQAEQSNWMQEVRGALVQTDAEVSDKITAALSQLANRMLSERENMEQRFKQLHHELTEQSRAKEEASILQREAMKNRFQAIEEGLKTEQESRVFDLRKNSRDQTQSHESTVSALQRLETAQADGFRRVDANALRSVKETQSAISEFRQTVEEAQTTLEEVVRAEIKARMRSHEKLKSTQETGINKLGSSIEMVRNEAAARLEGAMKSLVGRADIVDEKIENVQREMVTTLANQSRSQALVNSEMLGRLDAVENREKADENEWENAVENINGRIDKYARANTDAIGALQSVVGDHRRQADEAVTKLRADLTNDLKLMNNTANAAMTQWSTDSHHELEMLRTEAAKAFENLRNAVRSTNKDQTKASLIICDKLHDLQTKYECSSTIDTISNAIVGRVTQQERENIRSELESEQVQGLLSDMVDNLESATARDQQQAEHAALKDKLEVTAVRLGERLDWVNRAIVSEKESREVALAEHKGVNAAEHEELNAATQSIADGITSTAVELEVAMKLSDMLSKVSEQGVLDASDAARTAAETSASAVQKEMEELRASMLAQEKVNADLKTHIEAVVGTFEQTKREEAAQWEKSMLESEKLMDEMDDDEEMMGCWRGCFR